MKMLRTREWRDPLVQKLIHRHRGLDPEEIVVRAAETILTRSEQRSFPIDVELCASILGIKRRLGEYPFAGRIYAEPSGQLVMDLSGTDSEPRRRFTCGHEITHTVFPGFTDEARYRLDTVVGNHTPERNEEEYLCDIGAAELLLPAPLVRERFDLTRGLVEVENLASAADASLEASANKLVDVSGHPIGVIVLEVGYKPADRGALRKGVAVEKRLRVRYAKCKNIASYIPRFKSVDEDTVWSQALSGSDVVTGEEQLPADTRGKRFFVEAKRYDRPTGDGVAERVIAVFRPR